MRFQITLLAFLSLFLFAAPSHAFVGPTCMELKDSVGNKPDILLRTFQSRICDKGCKPVIAHYDKWASKNVVKPLIQKVMKDMGVQGHTKTVESLAADVVKVIKKECWANMGRGHLCQDPQTLSAFGNCLKSNLMPVVMGRIGQLMPLVAEPVCKKEKEYLEKDDLWKKVIPSYLEKYAAVCKKL